LTSGKIDLPPIEVVGRLEDVMAGGNFDQQLYINPATGFVEWPTGPLVRFDGETIERVEVWVMQKLTGAIQMTYQTSFSAPYTSWKADKKWFPNSANWTGGLFQTGKPALGIAVVIAKRVGAQSYYWWSEEVELY
jgi:hypothetical protein